MRHAILVALLALVALVACVSPTWAFSPIGNVDGWASDRLAKAGITVTLWRPDAPGEDPPLEWVQVRFDCSRVPEQQDVLMTLWITSERGTAAVLRAERGEKGRGSISLLFAVKPEYQSQSHLEIVIWADTPDGGRQASGYHLSMKRIAELARETLPGKIAEGGTQPPRGSAVRLASRRSILVAPWLNRWHGGPVPDSPR